MQKGDNKGTRLFNGGRIKSITYRELLDMYFKSLEIQGRSKETLKTYKHHNKYFLEFLKVSTGSADPKTNVINLQCFEEYIKYMQDVKKLDNNSTINSYMQNISPLIKWGYERGFIGTKFNIPYLKVQEIFKDIFTEDELNTLLIPPKGNSFVDIRNWSIIWTLASTGIRAKEIRHLKVCNVDLINRCIAINITKNKKPRMVPISSALYDVLGEYMDMRQGEMGDYLFPTVYNDMMERTTLQKQVKDYCNKRGIEKSGLHIFRHTFITIAVRTNVSPLMLKRITGHSSLTQLNKYYQANVTDLLTIIDNITPVKTKKKYTFK